MAHHGYSALWSDTVAALLNLSPRECFQVFQKEGAFVGKDEVAEQLEALVCVGVHPMQMQYFQREEPMDAVLDSFDIDGIAKYIREHGCKRIVVMCGAGISTSAGIPDFRTPGTGLYDNLQKHDLPRPEAIFSLDYFRVKPAAFYELAKDLWPGNYEPTPTHYFLKLLSDKGVLLRCYSQNIDSLECQAGLPKDKLVAAHGNFDGAHVIDREPEVEVDINELKRAVDQGEAGWQALREEKGNLVKPKIVFFGESLPERFAMLHQQDLQSCDLLIVLGTSLVVQPFAGLVNLAESSVPRLLINRDPAGNCNSLEGGFRYQKEGSGNWRDVFHAGNCDDGCRALAKAMGWEADFERLVTSKGTAKSERAPWTVDLTRFGSGMEL